MDVQAQSASCVLGVYRTIDRTSWAEKVKIHYYLKNEVCRITKWMKPSTNGFSLTHCPFCQADALTDLMV
ncbi:hypothetical protein QUF64_03385 [Anaerolineales bacterium HSG6]|nr:hypothetical protein [Anaerolineales bacterium HSG6]